MKKIAPRAKSPEELADETTYCLRSNLPHVTTRYVGADTVVLSANGVEVASKTSVYKRGKVVSVLYVLPSLARYEALMALPVAR